MRPGEEFRASTTRCEHSHGSGICPVCGKCIKSHEWTSKRMPASMTRTNAKCPRCGSLERHRVAALVEQSVPTLFPEFRSRRFRRELLNHTDNMFGHRRGSSQTAAANSRRSPVVAYFGPHPPHAAALRKKGVDVKGFDYFAKGYVYDKDTTVKADLSGKLCGGGWREGNGDFQPEKCVPIADKSVDGIIILHVLEHVLPLDPALEQLARIAKPGAWMQVEVPCEPDRQTHSCRRTYNTPKIPGTSGACNQGDHLIAYKCDDFIGLVETSGWRCVTSWEALRRPDEWLMNKYGIYDGVLEETGVAESWVTAHDKRQYLCTRSVSAAVNMPIQTK